MVVAGRPPLRYAITSLGISATTGERRSRLEQQLRHWAVNGIDFVQLREKDLDAGEVYALARLAVRVLSEAAERSGEAQARRTRLLINGRADIAAAAAGCDGVHLTARPGELAVAQVRQLFLAAGRPTCTVSVSCHTLEQARSARDAGADLVLFGPVFEKRVEEALVAKGSGLDLLAQACAAAAPMPVLALGGVNPTKIHSCLAAGAAGFAGIRLFES